MIKKFIKIVIILSLILINSACSYSQNKFVIDRNKCIFDIEQNIYSTKRNTPFITKPADYKDINKEPKKILQEYIDINNSDLESRALEIANQLVGLPGTCLYIADLFLSMFYCVNTYAEEGVEVSHPRPGDILYYADGGLGIEHWAIYINESLSLQGNFNGVAILMNGYLLNNASYPIFLRVYK